MKRSWFKIIIVLAFLLIIIQFIPVNKINPAIVSEMPAQVEVQKILQRSCFDCHSHETIWPWYSYIAPVSWLIAHDVKEGREHLNFSTWSQYDQQKQIKLFEEIKEVIEKEEMPLTQYLWMHPGARLDINDQMILNAWLVAAPAESPKISVQ
jgi:hypothetical protein